MALNLRLSCFRPLFLSREPLTPKALSKPRRVCQAEVTSQHSQPRRDLSIKSTARTFRESQCLRVQHNGVRALRRPQQCRWHSSPAEAQHSKVYSFDEVKSIVERPSKGRILIDVREPSEYSHGYIPTAINVPLKSQPNALLLSEDEFEERFDFPKPDPSQEVVFYCKSGVRSSAAAQLASRQGGYGNVAEYRGSWLDWEKNGGKIEMPSNTAGTA